MVCIAAFIYNGLVKELLPELTLLLDTLAGEASWQGWFCSRHRLAHRCHTVVASQTTFRSQRAPRCHYNDLVLASAQLSSTANPYGLAIREGADNRAERKMPNEPGHRQAASGRRQAAAGQRQAAPGH